MTQSFDVCRIYAKFTAMVRTQFNGPIKVFPFDGAHEYLSSALHNLTASQGTLSQLSCPYTPQHNGVFLAKVRHVIRTVRAPPFYFYAT